VSTYDDGESYANDEFHRDTLYEISRPAVHDALAEALEDLPPPVRLGIARLVLHMLFELDLVAA
jgi:hypothetical protein